MPKPHLGPIFRLKSNKSREKISSPHIFPHSHSKEPHNLLRKPFSPQTIILNFQHRLPQSLPLRIIPTIRTAYTYYQKLQYPSIFLPKECTYILPKRKKKKKTENSNTNPDNNFVLKWVRELVPSEQNIGVSVQLPDNAQNKHVIRDLIKLN